MRCQCPSSRPALHRSHADCAQVREAAEVPQAALAARARQELALTIARWTAVVETNSVLLKLDAQLLTAASNTSLATHLLAKNVALARLTAKTSIQLTVAEGGGSFAAAAASKETLGAAAAAWSQLPWPVGSTHLLRMAVAAAARVAVSEAMASSAGQPAFDAWQTAGRIVDAVMQALQQADLPVRSLPQAAFGPMVAATLSADADSHAGRGAVAVATALLVRAAGAVQTEPKRSAAREADQAYGKPTGVAHRNTESADRSRAVAGRGADGVSSTPVRGEPRQASSDGGSSSRSGASSDSSGSSSDNSASSGITSKSSGSSSGGSTSSSAISGSTGSGSSSADSQQQRGEHRPVAGPATARTSEPHPARVDSEAAGTEALGTGTVQTAAAGPAIAADAGLGMGLTGEGAADSGTEAESGEIGLTERGAASPSSSASRSSSSSGSGSGSASGSASNGSSVSTSASSGSSDGSSGGRQQLPTRQRGPQTAMEARAVFEAVLIGSQDR